MAYCDYIHCESCDCKLVYDGYGAARDRLEENYGPEWKILCPTCLLTLRAQLAESEREVAALRADAAVGERWRENSSLEEWFPLTAQRIADLEAERAALMSAGKVLATETPAADYPAAWHVCNGDPGALAKWMSREGEK